MISEYTDGYFRMMRDIGIGYQIAREQRIKEREKLLRQKNSDSALVAWEEREQKFPFPFSRGQTAAYNVWKESKTNGLETVECRDLPWEKDFHDFIATLREAGVDAFIVTDSSFSKERYTTLFEREGCKIIGPQKFVRHEKRSTGIENVNVAGILVRMDIENIKEVDSHD